MASILMSSIQKLTLRVTSSRTRCSIFLHFLFNIRLRFAQAVNLLYSLN